MTNQVTSPFTVFYDRAGQPLDAGYVYIGTAGINPEVSPITVYWDSSLTTTAAQPIRTLAGYPSRDGSPGTIIINATSYSIVVRDKNGTLVFSNLNAFVDGDVNRYVATYAELTALTTATGVNDGAVYYTRARTTADDGGAGSWRYDATSTATANGGTVLAINGGGAGRFFRLYTKGQVEAQWFGLTIGSTSGSVPADNVTAITAAMVQCNADGGGEVILPPTGTSYIAINATIDNIHSNVMVRGTGRGWSHDTGANQARGGTRILSTAAITMARHRTPSGGPTTPREDGGGFIGITFDSGATATRIMHVTSRYGGVYNFYFVNCEGTEAVLFDSLVTGTTLGESADNQNFDLDVVGRLLDTAASDACIGVVFDGSSNANTSISAKVISIDIIHTNGDAVWFKNADNLLVNMLRSIAVGTGRPFLVSGSRAGNATYTDALHIDEYSGTNAASVEGTDTPGVVVAGKIIIDRLDNANGTPLPTGGTGAIIVRRNSIGNCAGYGFENLVAGEGQFAVISGKAAIPSTASMLLYNGSGNHLIFADGTNTWGIRISGNDLEFIRTAGTGKLNLPDASNVLVNAAQMSYGANDSGGVGFKLLRVPN